MLQAMMMKTMELAGPGSLSRRLWFGNSEASSVQSGVTDDLFIWLWWFCVFWFILLMGLTFYFVVKYRRRPGVAPERDAARGRRRDLRSAGPPRRIGPGDPFRGCAR